MKKYDVPYQTETAAKFYGFSTLLKNIIFIIKLINNNK